MNDILELIRRCNSQEIVFNYLNDELSVEVEAKDNFIFRKM